MLAGTWTVTVNRPAPLPPLTSLQVYTGEGSMVESGSESMSRSPQCASYERVRGREYVATGLFLRFDPQTAAFLGKQKINRTIDLAQDGESFTFRGRGTTYDANGNVVASFPVSAAAGGCRSRSKTRFTRECGSVHGAPPHLVLARSSARLRR